MEALDMQIKMLSINGIVRYPTRRQKFITWIIRFWNFFTTSSFMAAAFVFVFKSNDVLDISESMAPAFTSSYNVLKYIVFCLYAEDLFMAMDEIRVLNKKWSAEKEQSEILQNANEIIVFCTKFFLFLWLFAGMLYIIKPLVLDLINEWILHVPPTHEHIFLADYIFNTAASPGYEITYFTETCLILFVDLFSSASAGIFICYCLNITAHFEILRNIVNDAELGEFVRYHRKVIELTQKLSNLYRPIIFTQFVIAAIILCLTGVQVIVNDDFAKILTALFHAVAVLIDVGIYSYGGQRVMDSACAVFEEAYKIDKDYIPIILMSQKKLKFDSGLFEASLDTYSILLSRTMSFTTLLKSFVK